jgi:dimethylhistidine N-methyltransferase
MDKASKITSKRDITHVVPTGTADMQTIDPDFAKDVLSGLSARRKSLPSKYLYNKKGDEIFQQIMAMEEYYPTRCEYQVFENEKARMLNMFTEAGERFDLVEFGAGDGMKTKVLLEHFWQEHTNFKYIPIDISANIVQHLTDDLQQNMPGLSVEGIVDDYFRAFRKLNKDEEHAKVRKVVLFLGANIGNFDHDESVAFLRQTASYLNPGDRLLIGFDLKKEPQRILNAYFDKQDITKSFKLNLLDRINEELGGQFQIDDFDYFPIYEPVEGCVKSHLVSKKEQDVRIEALDTTIHFDAWEAIFMERSQKFSLHDIEELAERSGFKVKHNFYDEERLFTDSLWTLQ